MKSAAMFAAALAGAAVTGRFAAWAGLPHSAPDIAELAAPCAACHRADGQNSGIPPIAGLDERRILQRMAEFRRQTSGDQIMHVVANALTEQETAALASYFGAHPAAVQR